MNNFFKRLVMGHNISKLCFFNLLFHQQLSVWQRKQSPGRLPGFGQTTVHITPPECFSSYLSITRQIVIVSEGYHALLAGTTKRISPAAASQPGAEMHWGPASKAWWVIAELTVARAEAEISAAVKGGYLGPTHQDPLKPSLSSLSM